MFQMVSTETRIAQDIVSSVKIHGSRVSGTLDGTLVSFLADGRTITGTWDVQDAVIQWILHDITVVEAAEKAHLDELAKLAGLREKRDAVEQVLYRKALGVRGTIESTAGPGKSSQLVRLDPGLSRVDSEVLRRYCRAALEKLTAPGFEVTSESIRGATLNAQETADDLRPALEEFEEVLDAVRLRQRVTEEAQRVKNEALERLHFVVVNGSRMFEAFYNLAGERFHAERLRSSGARSSVRPAQPASGPRNPADSSDDGSPAGEEPSTEEASSLTVEGETPDSASG